MGGKGEFWIIFSSLRVLFCRLLSSCVYRVFVYGRRDALRGLLLGRDGECKFETFFPCFFKAFCIFFYEHVSFLIAEKQMLV